jgi:hypothetical protein
MAHRSFESNSGGGDGGDQQQRQSPLQSTAGTVASLTSSSLLSSSVTRLNHGHDSYDSSPMIYSQQQHLQQQYPTTAAAASPATSSSSGLRSSVTRSSPIAIVPSNHNNNSADTITSRQNRNHLLRQQADLASSDDDDDYVNDNDGNDDDDDDDSVVDVERDAMKLRATRRLGDVLNQHTSSSATTTTSRSLPSRLLRAPRLSFIPTRDVDVARWMNEDNDLGPETILPPPMALADVETQMASSFSSARAVPSRSKSSSLLPQTSSAATTLSSYGATAYGSLRESHLRGRFLDGPQSYRDSTTGDLKRIVQQEQQQHHQRHHHHHHHHRVRFQEEQSASTYTGDSPISNSINNRQNNNHKNLSIAERMRQATAERQKKTNSSGSDSSCAAAAAATTATNDGETRSDAPREPTSRLAAIFGDRDSRQHEQSSHDRVHNDAAAASIRDGKQEDMIPAAAAVTAASAALEYGWRNDVDMGGHNIRDNDHEIVDSLRPRQMLSTSFTGLELLQRGLRLATIIDTTSSSINNDGGVGGESSETLYFDSPEFLPRDAQGNNAMFGPRSYSDPGVGPRRQQHQVAGRGTTSSSTTPSPAIGATSVVASSGGATFPAPFDTSPFLLPPAGVYTNSNNTATMVENFNNAASTTSIAMMPPPFTLNQSNAAATVYQTSFLPSPTTTTSTLTTMTTMTMINQPNVGQEEEENPDVEGAFDMDME